jgi:hypothetical protein
MLLAFHKGSKHLESRKARMIPYTLRSFIEKEHFYIEHLLTIFKSYPETSGKSSGGLGGARAPPTAMEPLEPPYHLLEFLPWIGEARDQSGHI